MSAASPYFAAIVATLTDAASLTGRGKDGAEMLARLAGAHSRLPPPRQWRNFSRLAADGAPVELVESLGARGCSLGFTVDPGPYGASPSRRLDHALSLASAAWPVASRFASVLFPPERPLGCFTLWLGWSLSELRIYAALCEVSPEARLERALEALRVGGFSPRPDTRASLTRLAKRGCPVLLGIALAGGQATGAKLYVRLRSAPADLRCFAPYLRALPALGDLQGDPNLGEALALGPGGGVSGRTLFHYATPYFADDASLRGAVLRAAPALGWPADEWRALSALIPAERGCRCRGLLGVTASPDGSLSLKLYASTGAIARAGEVRHAA